MGTTAEKLSYLNTTKIKIKDVLNLGGANITNETFRQYVDKIKDRYLYYMLNGTQVVWNNWNKVSGTGTSLTLNNTEEAPMSLTYKGNTQQSGTPTPSSPIPVQVVSGYNVIEVCGKNKLSPTSDFETTHNSVTFKGNNGTYTIKGTATGGSASITKTLLTKEYTVKSGDYLHLGNTSVSASTSISYYFTDNTSDYKTFNTTNRIVDLSSYVGKTINGISFWVANNLQVDLTIMPMILNTSTATTYEEYKGASYEINLGKNLFDIGTSNSDYVNLGGQTSTIVNSVSKNSISMTIAGSGGTCFYRNQKLNGNNTYTISFKAPNRYFRLYFRIRNIDDTDWLTSSDFTPSESGWTYNQYYGGWFYEFTTISSSSIYEKTITIPNCSYWLIGFGANTVVGQGTVQTISNIQVEKGTKVTSYSEYFTPIELCKIGTYQDTINKNKGTNLFDINDYQNLPTIFDYTKYSYRCRKIQLKSNTNYVVSFNAGSTSNLVILMNSIEAINDSATHPFLDLRSANGTMNFTTDSTGCLYIGCLASYTDTDYNNRVNNCFIEINEGTTALPYEPYGTGWYLKKEIGKVVLNGSEMWNLRADISYSDIAVFRDNDYVAGSVISNSLSICNYLTPLTSQQNAVGLRLVDADNYGYQVQVPKTIASTSAEFQTWVTNHNLIIYHPLKTPTYETITDTTLLSQLEALKKSYENVTNISQVNNDMPFELDVVALEEMN